MPPIPPLFTVNIETGGTIMCTQPAHKVYLLTFDSPPDNRLKPAFLKAFLLALDIVDYKLPKGVLMTTSAIPKFYSNGLDYESAIKTKGFFNQLYTVWRRLLTYPMPTVAVINGHAFAAGLMTAMMHDYRLMNPHKGFLCLNELEFGAPIPPAMASVFRVKLPRPDTFRTMILEAKRFNALEAVKEGYVDALGGVPEALKIVQEMKLVGKADSGVYGRLKQELWRETVSLLERGEDTDNAEVQKQLQAQQERDAAGRERVTRYEAEMSGKSKL